MEICKAISEMNDVDKNLISATRISASVYLITKFGLTTSCKSPTKGLSLAVTAVKSFIVLSVELCFESEKFEGGIS
jgi:hypothetical protein